MGLFSKVLSPLKREGLFIKPEEHLKLLDQGIGILRLSTFYCLQKKYLPRFGVEKASALAAAVVGMLVVESLPDERCRVFYDRNKSEITMEAGELHKYEQFSGRAGCASYLLAAEIARAKIVKAFHITDATKVWKSNLVLQERAESLGIFIPTGQDICGSEDTVECIRAIRNFAKLFYYTNTWSGPSPALPDALVPAIDYTKILLVNIEPLPTRADPQTAKDHNDIPLRYAVVQDCCD